MTSLSQRARGACLFAIALMLCGAPGAIGQQAGTWFSSLAKFELSELSSDDRQRLESAADWLEQHIARGCFQPADESGKTDRDGELSVIAWKDPTLHPQETAALAGYLITDTLWATVALEQLRRESAVPLGHTLDVLAARSNGLQEVLFGPIPRICHRPADKDFVHGVSVGRIQLNPADWIDVRMFHMVEDHAFTLSHPRLFAEHTGYQALFEYWGKRSQSSKQRLRRIFDRNRKASLESPVVWDHERKLLIDRGNYLDWRRMDETGRCAQFPIKLGVILYALRCTGLDREFPDATAGLESRLWQAQRPDGGLAHSIVVDAAGNFASRSGATGEATALAILAGTVVDSRHHVK